MTQLQQPPKWRTLLILGRTSNVPTVWSNCLVGWLMGGIAGMDVLIWLSLGATLLYVGGMYLNDAFDAGFDRRFRQERPIPAGHIEEKTVWLLGWGAMGLGFLCLVWGGNVSISIGLMLLVSILKQKGTKLAYYSGNDYWPEAYPWYSLENYLCADQLAFRLCRHHNKHFLYYCPWIDYDQFSFTGVSDGNKFGSYIAEYKENFPKEYEFVTDLSSKFDFVDLEIHSHSTKEETSECMSNSIATLHVKHLEGYGFAIIESMARGRPVILHKKFAQNKSYVQWAIENVTALYFESEDEIHAKMKAIIECQEYRHWLQTVCSQAIRSLVNNQEQTNNLKKFLNELK